MKIFNWRNNKLIGKEYLYKGLNINLYKKNIISFVGAGGKTTLIYNLGEELKKLGKRVIITTTTNMFINERYFFPSSNLDEISEKVKNHGIAVVGTPIGNGKFTALNGLSSMELSKICDFLLIESDGSRRLPLKAPDKHEPVIDDNCNMVIGVAGIDAVGKAVKDICHRKEIVCRILEVEQSHIVNEKDIAVLLSSERGQMKYLHTLGTNIDYIAVINKCDTDELIEKAKAAAEFLSERHINNIITSFK